MSETRPPITAGPIARALRFLKRTSVRGAVGEGVGVIAGGGASCACKREAVQSERTKTQQRRTRLVMAPIIALLRHRASGSLSGERIRCPEFAIGGIVVTL